MDKEKKIGEEPRYSDSKPTTRPITLEVPVQEQNLKLNRGGKKTISYQNWLRKRTQILAIEMYVHYAIDLLKQE